MRKSIFIPVYKPDLSGSELKYITNCIRTGWISSIGSYVTEFEHKFAEYCGTKYAVSTCNGTASLHLALAVLGIRKDDEIIVPSLTFIATVNSIVYTRAKPVFVDIDPEVWCIDPKKIEERITRNTKAILVVHLYGHPCDMTPILMIARKYNLWVVEDCAEGHGALYKGKKVGGIGNIGCFSFYGNKIITTGEGGMLTTNNRKLFEKMQFLKDHAMSKKRRYYHPEIGYNYRFTNIQAAIGLAQLDRIEEFIEKKRRIAYWYNKRLSNIPWIRTPPEKPWARNVYWMYSVLIDKKFNRDKFMKGLLSKGIDTRPFFYPIHKLPPYCNGSLLLHTEGISKRGINLPSYPGLKESEIEFISENIRSLLYG